MIRFSTALKLVVLSGVLMLAGCETKPKPTVDNGPPPPAQQETQAAPTSSIIPGSAEDLRVNVGDTVHFDYDKYEVLEADRAVLQRQAAWLGKYPSVRVTIEGHCDERGTREYNLALGARRANSVREFLVSHGVAPTRIVTISYGKERPIDAATGEDAWQKNRNGHTAITSGAS